MGIMYETRQSACGRPRIKRGCKGTYHKVSTKHLARYITEFAGRHKVRDLDTLAQMAALARSLDGRRLRYDNLVAGA